MFRLRTCWSGSWTSRVRSQRMHRAKLRSREAVRHCVKLFPKLEVIKKGAVWKNHFDENLDFKFIDKDSMKLGRQLWQLWQSLWHKLFRCCGRSADAERLHPRTGEEITRVLTPGVVTRCKWHVVTWWRITTGPAGHNQTEHWHMAYVPFYHVITMSSLQCHYNVITMSLQWLQLWSLQILQALVIWSWLKRGKTD